MNWLKTSARWPSAVISGRWSTRTSSFAGTDVVVLGVDETGSGELAQGGQGAEDGDPVAVEVLDGPRIR